MVKRSPPPGLPRISPVRRYARIGIDFDGTLADTGVAKQRWAAEHAGLQLKRSQCNRGDMLAAGMSKDVYNTMLLTVCDREHTLAAESCPGAVVAVHELSGFAALYIVTDRGEFQQWKEWCRVWLAKQGLSGIFRDLLSTEFSFPGGRRCDKRSICREHDITILIDDDLSNLEGLGQTTGILYEQDGGVDAPIEREILRASHWRVVPAICRGLLG